MAALIVGAGSESDHRAIRLDTKRGNRIPNEQRMERAPESLRAARDLWTRGIPGIRVRSLGATYNCVGMVFGARRTWIEPEFLQMILDDDGYYSLADEVSVMPGDLVVYGVDDRTVRHVGMVIRKSRNIADASWEIEVLSQWGGDGEFIHSIGDVPEQYGAPLVFYSERKMA